MYNYVLVMSAMKGEFTINSCFVVVVFLLFFYLFLDIDVYVLYQCSFEIFYAIKVVSFYLYFIYLKNIGKNIYMLLVFEYMIFISKFCHFTIIRDNIKAH